MATILTSSQQTFVDITDQENYQHISRPICRRRRVKIQRAATYLCSKLGGHESEVNSCYFSGSDESFIRCVRIIYQLETKRWNRCGKRIDRRRDRGGRNPYRK